MIGSTSTQRLFLWGFSILLLLLLAALHYAIVIAHESPPPRLPLPLFFTVLGCFALGLIVWTMNLFRR